MSPANQFGRTQTHTPWLFDTEGAPLQGSGKWQLRSPAEHGGPAPALGAEGEAGAWSGEVSCVSGGVCAEVLGEQTELLSQSLALDLG